MKNQGLSVACQADRTLNFSRCCNQLFVLRVGSCPLKECWMIGNLSLLQLRFPRATPYFLKLKVNTSLLSRMSKPWWGVRRAV